MSFFSPQVLHVKKFSSCSPCLEIPPSPFMKRLGFGTGVDVYLVERSPKHGHHRSPWAVKKINKRCGGDKRTYRQRWGHRVELKDEASILKELHHRNIVGFRGFMDRGDGECALVMEDGKRSLISMIEERVEQGSGPFPVSAITTVARSVAQALSYLHHEKLLLHGDLKSGNVLVQGDFASVKLCDFGVALRLDENLVVCGEDVVYVGTEPWSAKEVLQGGEVTNKSDIYAYGMLIYEMLTLSMPHMHVFPEEEDFEGVDQSSQEAWEEAEDEYQQSLGTRPPLLDYDYDSSYSSIIELFLVCSEELPQNRPSAMQIKELLQVWMEPTMADPKQKLQF